MPKRSRPTLNEVAQAAGVSVASASRALSGASASPEMVERVRAAAVALGYVVAGERSAWFGGDTGLFEVDAEWRWSGEHYRRTALDWLNNFDHHAPAVDAIFRKVYGADALLWRRRWRVFFLATAGLFGDSRGAVWGVSHYRLKPVPASAG